MMRAQQSRDSLAALESQAHTPSSTESPRPIDSRNQAAGSHRRWSRHVDPLALHNYSSMNAGAGKPASRPSSPLAESDIRALRAHRYAASPMDTSRKDPNAFNHSSSANTATGRRPEGSVSSQNTTSITQHLRQNPSIDGLTLSSLPTNSPVIRIIHSEGQTKVLNIKNCQSVDDIIKGLLKKLKIHESHFRNYCFYVLDGVEAAPANFSRL